MDAGQFKARIEQIHRDLDRYSYYELLNLTAQATPDEIRAAFHRMAMTLHPDRHSQQEDQELRHQIYAIYKRITEGYRVLMDPSSRRSYDAGLAEGTLRLEQTSRTSPSYQRPEDAIEHPKARQFFKLAQEAERSGNFKSARLNYKLALNLAPDHPVIQAHLEQLAQKEQGS